MSDLTRWTYKPRLDEGRPAPAGTSAAGASGSGGGHARSVTELLTKSRIESKRHQFNLSRRHPSSAFLSSSSHHASSTSSSTTDLPAPFLPQIPSHAARRRAARAGPAAPASWARGDLSNGEFGDGSGSEGRSAGSERGGGSREERARERRWMWGLWGREVYGIGREGFGVGGYGGAEGKSKGKGKEVAWEHVPTFGLACSGESSRSEDLEGSEVEDDLGSAMNGLDLGDGLAKRDKGSMGVASLQALALTALTRYCLDLPYPPPALPPPLPSSTTPGKQPPAEVELEQEEEDPLDGIRAIASLLGDERRMGMMLSRVELAGMEVEEGGGQDGAYVGGILGIWSGWDTGEEAVPARPRGGLDPRQHIQPRSTDEDPSSGSEEDQDTSSSSDEDWDHSPSIDPLSPTSPLDRPPTPLPTLDLSFLPSHGLPLAQHKLLRAFLHSSQAFAHLTRLSFAGAGEGVWFGDVMGLLPSPGGVRPRGLATGGGGGGGGGGGKDGTGQLVGKALRLTHLSLAGLKARDAKELERGLAKIVRIGSQLEWLDLTGVALFKEFGLWAVLGALFEQQDPTAMAYDPLEAPEVGSAGRGVKVPGLRTLGLRGLVGAPGEKVDGETARLYRDYVKRVRPGRWVDLVFE